MLYLIFVFALFSLTAEDTGSNSPEPVKDSPTGKIIVRIVSIENDNGVIRSHLYNNSDDFPTESDKAFMKRVGKSNNGVSIIVYDNVPYGEYAMTTHHDENNNHKMDKTWIGLPDEGWGVSNDAKATIALPAYNDAKFVVNKNQTRITITMRY